MNPQNLSGHRFLVFSGKLAGLFYSLCCYVFFLLTVLYLIGFLAGIGVPKDINSGPGITWPLAALLDAGLITLFAVQHSGMARKAFKRWWMRFIPATLERATYVLSSCVALTLLFVLWQPISTPVWNVESPWGKGFLVLLFWLGWGIVLLATFLISHFELFGLKQALDAWRKPVPEAPTFKTPLLYKLVRHPLYFGFLITFWATPDMTVGHLLFAILSTVYILIGAHLEEKDLVESLGVEYQRYQQGVGMLVPKRNRIKER